MWHVLFCGEVWSCLFALRNNRKMIFLIGRSLATKAAPSLHLLSTLLSHDSLKLGRRYQPAINSTHSASHVTSLLEAINQKLWVSVL